MPRKRGSRAQPPAAAPARRGASLGGIAALQQATAALSSALTMKDVAEVLFDIGLGRFGARAMGIVWSFAPGELRLAYGRGVTAGEFRALSEAAAAGARMPVQEALRTRAPVWVTDPEELRARYPALETLRALRGEQGFAVVPLVVRDRCPGFVGLTFGPEHVPGAVDRRFVEALAQLGAQAFDRARLFEAEQEARREAEQVGRMQEQLMAVLGHDLRTPLSAITYAAAALGRRGELGPESHALVQRIASSARRAAGLIRDLLDVSRARQGLGLSLRAERVDLGEVVRGALGELDTAPDGGRVTLAISGDVTLDGDPDRLAQVASNLVTNALKHGGGSPVSIEVRGEPAAVVLVVGNAGPPIPPELLPHVFEPFRRGSAAAERGEGASASTGLGLFIVREIVRAHDGAVELRSDAGAGTVVTVRLPRARTLG